MRSQVPGPPVTTGRTRRGASAGCRPAALLGVLHLILAFLAVPAPAQDRVDGDRYQNPRYGVQIEKPPGWHFITASTVMELARKSAGMPAPKR